MAESSRPAPGAYASLGQFIARLEREGELRRIKAPVSARLEITEITDRVSKLPGGGLALLFENVEGSAFPVLTNAFGGPRRICLALGVEHLDELGRRLREILDQAPPRSLVEKLALARRAVGWSRFPPRRYSGRTAPCQEVVYTGDRIDLGRLPVLTCWPLDGGPFVTLPVVLTKSLTTGRRNAGMYRLQVFDRQATGMHWHIHKDGSHYYSEYRRAGRRMEVAVAIGTDPAVTYAATAPLPRGVDEMLLAGFIRRRPVRLVKGLTVDLEVPAEAEFVLEGYVDPEERRLEGPFGDHTGYYSAADMYPVFHLTALTHRRGAVYPATIVGRPPMEDCYLAKATERLFLPLLQAVWPEIKDYWLPWEGVFHNVVVVGLAKEYPGHAAKVIHGLWGSGQMSFCKIIVVVDDDCDLTDPQAIWLRLLGTLDPLRDLCLTQGVLDVLDHSAPAPLFGGKLGLDATRRGPGEPARPARRPSGLADLTNSALLALLRALDQGFLACRILFPQAPWALVPVQIAKDAARGSDHFRRRLLDWPDRPRGGVFVFHDPDADLADESLLLWKGFNNVDPLRDLTVREDTVIIDATRKGPADGHSRPWPAEIVMSPEIQAQVTRRLPELGLVDLLGC